MDSYYHLVSGIYPSPAEAKKIVDQLVDQGLSPSQLTILRSMNDATTLEHHVDSDEVLNKVLVDGAVGTVVGAGAFGLGHLAFIAANISLFVASPILGPLIMLGWGASVGGLLGAVAGATVEPKADSKRQSFAHLIEDAINSGYVVLVARTMTEQETFITENVIRASTDNSNATITT